MIESIIIINYILHHIMCAVIGNYNLKVTCSTICVVVSVLFLSFALFIRIFVINIFIFD